MHPGLSREELTKLFHGDVPWQQVDLILSDCSEERNIDDVHAELKALANQRNLEKGKRPSDDSDV